MRRLKWWLRGLSQRLAPKLTFAILANRSWLHEPELGLLPLLSGSNALAVDAGANKGVYLYHLSRHFQRVVAFEPLPQMSAFLKAAAPSNTVVHALALSNASGEAEIMLPRGFNELASLEQPQGADVDAGDLERHRTPLRTLDSFGLSPLGLIKIDVEGHEFAVLEGARDTIARFHPTILVEVEERHKAGGIGRIRDLLEGSGYEGYFLDSQYPDGPSLRPIAEFDPVRDQSQTALDHSIKVGRYINNFIYFERRQAAERAAIVNRWLRMSLPARAAMMAEFGGGGVVPAWHSAVGGGRLRIPRIGITTRATPGKA